MFFYFVIDFEQKNCIEKLLIHVKNLYFFSSFPWGSERSSQMFFYFLIKNLDKEKNVPQVLIPESSQGENDQNSVPTKNNKEINSAISENVINENNISRYKNLVAWC